MKAEFEPLPPTWAVGSQKTVTVKVTGAPAGQVLTATLSRTAPLPRTALGSKTVNVTSTGDARALFSVTLDTPGINVLHCKAQAGSASDSDSDGTLVQ